MGGSQRDRTIAGADGSVKGLPKDDNNSGGGGAGGQQETTGRSASKLCDVGATSSQNWNEAAAIGLLTSESPDSVAAWRGRKRSQAYGKPRLACDEGSRVLVLPAPIYTQWPAWMTMDSTTLTSRSETMMMETEDGDSTDTFFKVGHEHNTTNETERFLRSSYTPNAAPMPGSVILE